jgi:hypothetical protein
VHPPHAGEPPDVGRPPRAPVVMVKQPPVIDGALDDRCWQEAFHVSGFVYPTENRPSTEPTEAWLCADSDYLYAAIYAHDSRPEGLNAQQAIRGGYLGRDDYVAVWVDSLAKGNEHYEFQCSASGTLADAIPQSGSDNYAWKGVWRAAARRVPDGFVVEFAIPLAGFRYAAGQKVFGIGFARNYPRARETSFWPKMADRYQDYKLARWGPLKLKPREDPALILPYAIGAAATRPTVQTGLDVKKIFANGVTGLATANPDFKTIEDVVDSIAFSYAPRQLGETRPFFKEGAGYFPDSTAWYSRTVPSVITGAKTFGRLANSEFGALAVLGDHSSADGAFNYRYRLNQTSYLGSGLVVHEDDVNHTNWVSANRFRWYQELGPRTLSADASFYHSVSAGHGGDGNAGSASISYGGMGRLSGWASAMMVSPCFQALDGYVPDPDIRGYAAGLSGYLRTQKHWLQIHSYSLSVGQYTKQDGSVYATSYNAEFYGRVVGGYAARLRLYSGLHPPYHDRSVSLFGNWGLDRTFGDGGSEVTIGRRGGTDYMHLALNQGYQPVDALRLSVSSEFTYRYYGDHTSPTLRETQNIATANWQFDPLTSVSMRFIERHGALDLFLAYKITRLSGHNLYFFFGDPNAARTVAQVEVKVIWPL